MQANNNDKVLKEFGSNVQLALDASIMQFMEYIATNIMDDIKDLEGFTNQTFNLEDSYGCGIYKDGVLKKIVWANATKVANEPRKRNNVEYWWRELAEDFFNSYKSDGSEKYELVVAAVMYYAKYVENYHLLNVLSDSWIKTKTDLKGGKYTVVFKKIAANMLNKYFK